MSVPHKNTFKNCHVSVNIKFLGCALEEKREESIFPKLFEKLKLTKRFLHQNSPKLQIISNVFCGNILADRQKFLHLNKKNNFGYFKQRQNPQFDLIIRDISEISVKISSKIVSTPWSLLNSDSEKKYFFRYWLF